MLRTRPQTPALLDASHGAQGQFGRCFATFPIPPRFASGASEASVILPMRSEVCLVFVSPFGRAEQRRALRGARQRASTTDFGRLFERSERSERGEFGARPRTPSTAEQSALGPTASVGSLFLW